MAYTALYRKWRPLIFDDVVGQKSVTETLKNEIQQGKAAHAYLFCGIRGTGKTSTARILARAINCTNPQNGNPCNKCENCRGILDGSILDITEIDAASNNGVDNIRSLREEARFSGSILKERVYIIDEVHMLSTSAFNALLKILEEPPAHVHFILATTEAQKVPATILSRCQRFDFKRITNSDIENQIKKILAESDSSIEERAVSIIAEAADGSMRDALSILDQCMSIGTSKITYDEVSSFLGVADSEYIERLIKSIASSDIDGAFKTISDIVSDGKSIPPIATSLLKRLRDMLINKYSGKDDELSSLFTPQKLLLLVKYASEIPSALRTGIDMRLCFELTLIKMLDPSYDTSYESVVARISDLEKIIENGTPAVTQPKQQIQNSKKAETHKPDKSPEPKKPKTDFKSLIDKMYELNKLNCAMALEQASISFDSGKLILQYDSRDNYEACKLMVDGEKESIISAFKQITGENCKLELSYKNTLQETENDALAKLYNDNKDIIMTITML